MITYSPVRKMHQATLHVVTAQLGETCLTFALIESEKWQISATDCRDSKYSTQLVVELGLALGLYSLNTSQ